MDKSIFLGLIQNTALLIASSMIYDYFWSRHEKPKGLLMQIIAGIFTGFFGIVLIMTPWHLVPGIVFDVRSVLLSISGLFLGPVPTFVAVLITGIYRMIVGGSGMMMGVSVIITAGMIGVMWKLLIPDWRMKKPALQLLAMGYVVHMVMLACTSFLPFAMIWPTIKTIIFPLLTIYPLGNMLLGLLMIHYEHNAQNKEALKTTEKRFRTIIEKATDAMFLIDFKGKILDVNEQTSHLLGFSRNELLQMSLPDLDVLYNDMEKVRQAVEELKAEKTSLFETMHRTKEGAFVPVEISVSIIDLDARQLIIGFARNLTDRKKIEAQIRQLNEELEQRVIQRTAELEAANAELEAFSYSVSHDLRTPLRAIDSFTGILQEDFGPFMDPEARRLLGIVTDNTAKMGQLIDDLLAFSRFSRKEMLISRINMMEMARSAYEELMSGREKEHIDFRLDPIPDAYGDPSMVRQVWLNLLSNAIKFTSGKSERIIEIRAQSGDKRNTYIVKDNGAGFDMNYIHKMFVVFQRLHSNKEFEGTGVGLALVRRILLRMNGSIRAEGKVDEGAVFYFELPSTSEYM